MIYVLLGKSCSGKTTAWKQLVELGFKTAILYTTRPVRRGEYNGVDYNFISELQFKKLDKLGYLTAKHTFNNWHYALKLKDLDTSEDLVIVLEPECYSDLVEEIGDHHITGIYLDTPTKVRWLRGLNRGDNVDELVRRFESDEEDFEGLENEVDHVVVGLEKKEILDKILKLLQGGQK